MSLLPSSSQLRYAMAYILVTAVVLVILNIYTSTTMRQITFSAQKQALEEKAQLMTTALLQVSDLSSPETEQAIESLDELHTTRTVVVDASGMALYDSLEIGNSVGKLLLFPEGTRIRNGVDKYGKPAVAHTGAAMLASRTGVPLIPMYIPEEKPWFRPTTVVIGKPFMPVYEGRKPTANELEAITGQIMGGVAALKEGTV